MHSTRDTNIHKLHPFPEKSRLGLCRFSTQWNNGVMAWRHNLGRACSMIDLWFALCYWTVVLSCLSVTLVHCGQTVGRIKMKLSMHVGLGPGHIVLYGDPAPLSKGTEPPVFGPYLLRPNGCMNQDTT